MSESTISTSYDNAVRKRGAGSVTTQYAVPGTGESTASQTMAAPEQPAAIVSKSLARFSAGERTSDEARQVMDSPSQTPLSGTDWLSTSNEVKADDGTSPLATKQLLAQVQAQFQARAQKAVLAQANQMPNDAMPFSTAG